MFTKKFFGWMLFLVVAFGIMMPVKLWSDRQIRMARVPAKVMAAIDEKAAHAEAEVVDVCRVLVKDQKTGEVIGKTDRSVSGNVVYKYWDATFTQKVGDRENTATHRFCLCLLKGKVDSVRMIS